MDRRILGATRGFFDGRSTILVALLGLAFIGVVAVLDYLTGPSLSLSLLYLMPIGLVTWNLGRRWGAVAVIVSTLMGIAADVVTDPALGPANPAPYWNALIRFTVFLAFVMLLDTLRAIIDAQWAQVELEAEVSTGLRQLNDVKNTLLHAVSHDLKNPLSGILGAMQTIRRDRELRLSDVERNSLYDVIEQSGTKMNRLIDDLLDLDRIDRGKLQPRRQPTDVGELARRLVSESTSLGGHPVRVASEPLLVDVDAAKIERVIDNLLINASRHTPAGTLIQVRVDPRDAGIVLVVEDQGPGIPDELKDVLFEPFRQGEGSSGRGVGIGLSLVQRFAELHGGTAHVEDHEGGGARFVITLPGEVTRVEQPLPPAVEDRQLRAV